MRGANSHTDRSLGASSVFGETAPVDCVSDMETDPVGFDTE